MPNENNCIPLTKNITHIIDGHPEVGSPYASVLIMINNININATKQNNNPITEDIINGVVEKAVIPSIAYLKCFTSLFSFEA